MINNKKSMKSAIREAIEETSQPVIIPVKELQWKDKNKDNDQIKYKVEDKSNQFVKIFDN